MVERPETMEIQNFGFLLTEWLEMVWSVLYKKKKEVSSHHLNASNWMWTIFRREKNISLSYDYSNIYIYIYIYIQWGEINICTYEINVIYSYIWKWINDILFL